MLRTSFKSNSLLGGVKGLPDSDVRNTSTLSKKERARQKKRMKKNILHGWRITRLTAFRLPRSSWCLFCMSKEGEYEKISNGSKL